MPEEVGTEETRSDAPSADDSPFGDAAEDTTAAVEKAEDSTDKEAESPQGSADAGEQKAGDEGEQAPQSSGEAEEQTVSREDLRVVVSIKGSRASIGVQQPSSDPHIETFGDLDESRLAQEVPAVIERARITWEDYPKHPAYERPAAPTRSRNRRGQGSAQTSNAKEGAEAEQAQQQTLKLF